MSIGKKKVSPAKAEIKFPRVIVSVQRHKALAAEAKKLGATIQEVAEKKFKAAK